MIILKKNCFYKNIILSSFIFFFIFISCSNSQETKLVYTESNTIKQSVKEKEQDITWTLELEEERLSEIINRNSMVIGADVPYTKEIFKISKENQSPVYPSLGDFGSLDTRNLRSSVKDKLNNFCEAFSSENHNGADSFFNRKYIFNYVFFLNDFEEGWKENFSEEIPDSENLFTKWIFGEPFNGYEIIQIPVRFYSDCGTIDMTMYLNASGSNEFYQITIDRWQKV